VRLDYFVDGKSVCDEIEVEWTDCNFGGRRAWWTCPRCSKRRRTLYLPPGRMGFACRVCHKLVFRSQQLGPIARRLIGLKTYADLVVNRKVPPPEDDEQSCS